MEEKERLESGVPRARAIRAMREWMEKGLLKAGEALPSERALAKRLGVGRATVRRALAVLEAEGWIIDRGGHVRIVAAGGGAQGFMRRVVAVVADGATGVTLAAMQALSEAGVHAMLVASKRLDEGQMQQLVGLRPGGIVVPDGESEVGRNVIEAVVAAGLAVAAGGDGPVAGVDRVVIDYEGGAYELTRWAIGRGRRRVLTVWNGDGESVSGAGRMRGHERAVREAELEVLPPLRVARVQVEDGSRAEAEARLLAGYLMERICGAGAADAILAMSDGDEWPIAAACRMLGKEPGREVTIMRYDGESGGDGVAAGVDLRADEVGRELSRLVLERMERTSPAEGQRRVVSARVVVTEASTAETEEATVAEVPLTAAPQIGALGADQRGEPLFGWKMAGGRWKLGK